MSLIDIVKAVVKDTAQKLTDPDDFNAGISAALKRYSKHRPRFAVADLAGNGTNDVALPSDWSDGFSTIESVEYPIGSIPEMLLDNADWRFYRTPTTIKIRLLEWQPKSTEVVRVLYTNLHIEASVAVADLEAVANLAGSYCCRKLAQIYAGTTDSSINADVVNYRSKSSEFSALAKNLEGLYNSAIGVKADDAAPAAMAVAAVPENRRTRLTHLDD